MDRQTAIINHRHMWNWLSENPEKKGRRMDKSDYMYKFNIDPIPYDRCFLCEYHYQSPIDLCGNTCILEWPDPGGCSFPDKLFGRWNTESDPSRRAELARQIRDLPEREENVMQGLTDYFVAPRSPHPWQWHTLEEVQKHPRGVELKPPTPPPPPKLTRAEAIAKTRKQWTWLAYNPSKQKSDYFDEIGMSLRDAPMFGCYLCEYTRSELDFRFPECGKSCPLQWPGGCCSFEESENIHTGLFEMWGRSEDDEKLHSSIAWLISQLPEKD